MLLLHVHHQHQQFHRVNSKLQQLQLLKDILSLSREEEEADNCQITTINKLDTETEESITGVSMFLTLSHHTAASLSGHHELL